MAVVAGAGVIGANQQAKANQRAIDRQSQVQADEIAKAAGVELSDAAKRARQERSAAIVTAGESGVSLGSGSFLAALQASYMQQSNEQGLIIQNENGQQRARQAQGNSLMAEKASRPTLLGAGLQIGSAAVRGRSMYLKAQRAGVAKGGEGA